MTKNETKVKRLVLQLSPEQRAQLKEATGQDFESITVRIGPLEERLASQVKTLILYEAPY